MSMANAFDIKLTNIKVVLPGGRVLFHVPDLSLPYGTHVLIQGESGKGKSTFLHLLAGLHSPAEGEVTIGGRILAGLSDDEKCDFRREEIGVIFQKLNLLDHLTAEENISLPLRKNQNTASRIHAALARVNLKERAHDRCAHLSLGEQQRVAVARTLAQAPEIILADEPTSSLDDKNGEFVLEALRESARGRTLVVVSHDRRLRERFSHIIDFSDFTS